MNALTLKHGFGFNDLFESHKLKELADIFYNYYRSKDPESYQRFSNYKNAGGEGFAETEVSKILIESGRHLDNFLIDFFGLENQATFLVKSVKDEHAIIKVKSEFITRRVFKKFKEADIVALHFKELDSEVQILKDHIFPYLPWKTDEENATATMIHHILEWEQNYKNHLDIMPNAFVFDQKAGKEASDAYNKLKISASGKKFTEGLAAVEYKNTAAPESDKIVYEFIKNIVELLQKWTFAKIHAPEEHHKIKE